MSLLHWACDRGHRDVAELLINNGADINCQVSAVACCVCVHVCMRVDMDAREEGSF